MNNKFELKDVTNDAFSLVRINGNFVTFRDKISDEIEEAEKQFCLSGQRLYHNHGPRWNKMLEAIVNKTYSYDHSSHGLPCVVHYNYTKINVVSKGGILYARGNAYNDVWDTIYTARVPKEWEFFLQVKQEEISY